MRYWKSTNSCYDHGCEHPDYLPSQREPGQSGALDPSAPGVGTECPWPPMNLPESPH